MSGLFDYFMVFEFYGFWYINDYWFYVVYGVIFGVKDVSFYYMI